MIIIPIIINGRTVFMARKGFKQVIDSTPDKAKTRLLLQL